MAKTRRAHRKGSRKAHRKGSRKAHRKGSRKAHRKGSRKAHRKGSRKSRRANRRNNMMGGDLTCGQKLANAQIKAIQKGKKSSNVSYKNIPGCTHLGAL